MGQTSYDEASRHLNRTTEGHLLGWLVRRRPEQLRFEGWNDTVLFLPETKQRILDAAAGCCWPAACAG